MPDQGISSSNIAQRPTTSEPSNKRPQTHDSPHFGYLYCLLLANLLRILGTFVSKIAALLPSGFAPTRTTYISSTVGAAPGKIRLSIYLPSSGDSTAEDARPVVVNFHGGGFTFGSSTDDSTWGKWCVKRLNVVYISVGYRKAPEYPFPTPVEDCVSAILWIQQHSKDLNINPAKIIISGFSAGGSLAVTSTLLLNHPVELGYPSLVGIIEQKILGVVGFYPILDFSTTRQAKAARAKDGGRKISPIPTWMGTLFDSSYLHRGPDTQSPLLSPVFATEAMLARFPELHLCLCDEDVLMDEAEGLGEKVAEKQNRGVAQVVGDGGDVVIRIVKGARHGWDKTPFGDKESVEREYDAAIASMRAWLVQG